VLYSVVERRIVLKRLRERHALYGRISSFTVEEMIEVRF
jgi:hypothetical protein